jgi:AbrB family looped-hinge helix DNA binding protein
MHQTIMRAKGQLTIPAPIREAAHLTEGDPVEVELTSEGILLRPKKVIDSTQAWFWSASWQRGEAEASADLVAGRVTRHGSTEEFLGSLDE